MPIVVINGLEVNYVDEGEGRPIVLVHGLGDDITFWEPVIPSLSKKHRVIVYDLRGHGKTGKPNQEYSIRLLSNDLASFMKKIEIDRATLAGVSMGGMIAQQFAIDYSERILKLILIDTFAKPEELARQLFRNLIVYAERIGLAVVFDEMLPWVVTEEAARQRELIGEIKDYFIATNEIHSFISSIRAITNFDIVGDLDKIDAPTLILFGAQDIMIPPWKYAEVMHHNIRNSELKVIEGVAHGPDFTNWDIFNSTFKEFLNDGC